MALVYQRSGRVEEAIKSLEIIYLKDKALAGAALGYAYGKSGNTAKARKVLNEMTQLATQRYVPAQEFAIIYIGLGDSDNAFQWLEKAYEERFAGFDLFYCGANILKSKIRSALPSVNKTAKSAHAAKLA
jgi:Flp pilus assembly protein TadD